MMNSKWIPHVITVMVLVFLGLACATSPDGTSGGSNQAAAGTLQAYAGWENWDRVGSTISAAAVADDSLAGELQWLAVQTACIGLYNMAQTGEYVISDPEDYYKPSDIREYLTGLSGDRTKTTMFYGICFDYAQAAYDDILNYQSYYEDLGMKKGEWYIAAVKDNPGQIILYDPVSPDKATEKLNGVYIKENSRKNVRAHGGATWHAWLWVYGNDGAIYWIDPTWTDSAGYVWWGIVQDGKEVQRPPLQDLCMVTISSNSEAMAYTDSGNSNKNKGNNDQAIVDFTAALRIDPNNVSAYYGRGKAYIEKKMYDQAIEDYTAALRIDPNDAHAYYNCGNAYSNKNMYDRAIEDYTAALWIDPNFSYAYNSRGIAYYDKGMYDRAIEDYTAALRIDPNDVLVYYNRGIAYSDKGMYDRAIADYTAALRINPNYADAYINRGVAYRNKNMYDRAIADFTAALRIDPNYAYAYNNRGNAYDDKGMYDRAIADYTAALRIDPNDAGVYYNRGYVYSNKNMYDRAIEDYTAALRIDPNFSYAYNNRGNAYADKGMYNRAIEDWTKALQVDPNNQSARNNLAKYR